MALARSASSLEHDVAASKLELPRILEAPLCPHDRVAHARIVGLNAGSCIRVAPGLNPQLSATGIRLEPDSASSIGADNGTMITRVLGSTGPGVSSIGLGCMGMSDFYGPADEAESIATVHAALAAGFTPARHRRLLRHGPQRGAELTIVTPEERPLGLFGRGASTEVARLSAEAASR